MSDIRPLTGAAQISRIRPASTRPRNEGQQTNPGITEQGLNLNQVQLAQVLGKSEHDGRGQCQPIGYFHRTGRPDRVWEKHLGTAAEWNAQTESLSELAGIANHRIQRAPDMIRQDGQWLGFDEGFAHASLLPKKVDISLRIYQ